MAVIILKAIFGNVLKHSICLDIECHVNHTFNHAAFQVNLIGHNNRHMCGMRSGARAKSQSLALER